MECTDNSENIENSIQALFMKLVHRYSAKSYKKFMEMGVHPGQIPVMKKLYHQEGASQRELAEMLHVKPPTITVTIKRLEKAELVYRSADETDMRVSRIYLTEKGKSITEELCELLKENEQTLIRGFTESELCLIRRFFLQMIDNMEEETINKEGKKQ